MLARWFAANLLEIPNSFRDFRVRLRIRIVVCVQASNETQIRGVDVQFMGAQVRHNLDTRHVWVKMVVQLLGESGQGSWVRELNAEDVVVVAREV